MVVSYLLDKLTCWCRLAPKMCFLLKKFLKSFFMYTGQASVDAVIVFAVVLSILIMVFVFLLSVKNNELFFFQTWLLFVICVEQLYHLLLHTCIH